jgi:hypothetical protein
MTMALDSLNESGAIDVGMSALTDKTGKVRLAQEKRNTVTKAFV